MSITVTIVVSDEAGKAISSLVELPGGLADADKDTQRDALIKVGTPIVEAYRKLTVA